MKLHEEIAIAAELTGTTLSEAAAIAMAEYLATYDRASVSVALRRARQELRPRTLCLAAIIERIDDGRPGPEEAWAMLPQDERVTVVWTDEMVAAYRIAEPMIRTHEKVQARMVFKERYIEEVRRARESRKPVAWTISLGQDRHGIESVLMGAVAKGRISLGCAREFAPMLPAPREDVMSIAKTALKAIK